MLSLVIGVHHVWRHRRRADADEEDAVRRLLLPLPQLTSFRRVGTSASGPTDTDTAAA
jgi:hypothetical protein